MAGDMERVCLLALQVPTAHSLAYATHTVVLCVQATKQRAVCASMCCCVQGVASCIGGYDLVSGVRLGRVDVKSPPICLMFGRDGSMLVVATAVCVRGGVLHGADGSSRGSITSSCSS